VIPFFQKSWFLWWILATLIVLRWFHLFSSRTDQRALEPADSAKEEASAGAKPVPSGTASRLFT
jgi:hypothetical protein